MLQGLWRDDLGEGDGDLTTLCDKRMKDDSIPIRTSLNCLNRVFIDADNASSAHWSKQI